MRQLINLKDLSRFEVFLRLLAGRVGQILILSAMAAIWNRGRHDTLSFYRDSNGHEVDVVVERQRVPSTIEIKASQTFSPDFLRNGRRFKAVVPNAGKTQVIYGGQESYAGTDYDIWSFADSYKAIL